MRVTGLREPWKERVWCDMQTVMYMRFTIIIFIFLMQFTDSDEVGHHHFHSLIQFVWCDMQTVMYTRLAINILIVFVWCLYIYGRWRIHSWQFSSWSSYLRSFLNIVFFRAGGREACERGWARLFSRTVTTIVDTGPTTTWRMDLGSLHVRQEKNNMQKHL